MFTRPAQLLIPPVFHDDEKTRQARLLHRSLWFCLVTITAFGVIFFIRTTVPEVTAAIVVLFDFIILYELGALRRGRIKLVALLLTLTLWFSVTFIIIRLHGGLQSPAIESYLLITTLAGLLIGGGFAIAFATLSFLTLGGMLVGETLNLMPPPLVVLTPLTRLLWHLLNFFLAAVLVQTITRAIRDALERARDNQLHLRISDTVARLGGDEFAFIFERIQKADDAARIARKLLDALAEPLTLGESVFSITASIGISLSPEDGVEADSLVNKADRAMYNAKGAGKNRYQFFSRKDVALL